MSSIGSVSAWILDLKAGEESALGKLHRRYWTALVALARQRLRGRPARATDEEDIAQQAFWGFYQSLKAGRLPRLSNRQEFLASLTHIIACKAINQIEYATTQKRGGTRPRELNLAQVGNLPDGRPTPLEQLTIQDCYRNYLDHLPENLQPLAELYLAGYTHREIAARLGCVERSVERKIARVLTRWQQRAASELTTEAAQA